MKLILRSKYRKQMDSFLRFSLLSRLHPLTLDQIWKGNYEFVEREFSFLNGSELMKELGNRYVIENLCKVHGFERKKTFESFLRRWNLWFMFDEGIPTEHRILHHKDWIEDYRRVSMKPFGWKPSECELSKEGCSRKGKFLLLAVLELSCLVRVNCNQNPLEGGCGCRGLRVRDLRSRRVQSLVLDSPRSRRRKTHPGSGTKGIFPFKGLFLRGRPRNPLGRVEGSQLQTGRFFYAVCGLAFLSASPSSPSLTHAHSF